MTKKHFEAVARLIREFEASRDAKEFAAVVFARVAEESYPRFDRERFLKACGLGDD